MSYLLSPPRLLKHQLFPLRYVFIDFTVYSEELNDAAESSFKVFKINILPSFSVKHKYYKAAAKTIKHSNNEQQE